MADENPPVKATPTASPGDTRIVRLREYTAAGLAFVVVLGMVVLVVLAAASVASADNFGRLKDLLLFLNPLVGIVIGYYFNRVTSERRAENAESVAGHATEAATEADRQRADAETRARESANSLADLTDTVEAEVTARSRTLGRGDTTSTSPELQAALARARTALRRGAAGQ